MFARPAPEHQVVVVCVGEAPKQHQVGAICQRGEGALTKLGASCSVKAKV